MPVLHGNGTFGRELLAQQVIPTESNGWSGFGSLQHRIGSQQPDARRRSSARRSSVEEAFGWADASPSPTYGNTPALLAGVTNTHTWSRLLQEVTVGYFDLENTRISTNRDILNSTLGIYNPLEASIGGLAALMPTIDINTQRNSGGIGNAWDFFDRQRVLHASARWSLVAGRHTLQSGVEYRRMRLDSEYMSRTNGDLDYDNWVFFFTGHGASGGGSDLDQGDTRRDFRAQDAGVFVQDDWKIGGGLTLNAGLRYDVFGMLTEKNGRIGNYYLPEAAAELGVKPGFYVPSNAPFFQPGFDPLQHRALRGARHADRYEPDPRRAERLDAARRLQQRRAADRPRLAADVRAEVRRPRRLGPVLRAAVGRLQGRPAARRAVLPLSERAGAARHGRSRIRS